MLLWCQLSGSAADGGGRLRSLLGTAITSGPASTGCHVLVLAKATADTEQRSASQCASKQSPMPWCSRLSPGNIGSSTNTPASRQQISDMRGTSWAALAFHQDPASWQRNWHFLPDLRDRGRVEGDNSPGKVHESLLGPAESKLPTSLSSRRGLGRAPEGGRRVHPPV